MPEPGYMWDIFGRRGSQMLISATERNAKAIMVDFDREYSTETERLYWQRLMDPNYKPLNK